VIVGAADRTKVVERDDTAAEPALTGLNLCKCERACGRAVFPSRNYHCSTLPRCSGTLGHQSLSGEALSTRFRARHNNSRHGRVRHNPRGDSGLDDVAVAEGPVLRLTTPTPICPQGMHWAQVHRGRGRPPLAQEKEHTSPTRLAPADVVESATYCLAPVVRPMRLGPFYER
jgi:hypothetical protein